MEVLLARVFKIRQNKGISVDKHMPGEKGNRWNPINLFHV